MHPAPIDVEIEAATAWIRTQSAHVPRIGVVLGSGLGAFADQLEGVQRLSYRDIPHFPEPHVAGHAGELVLGHLGGVPLAVMSGRVHYYEGHDLRHVTLPVRVLHALGARQLVVTNAAGGLNESFGKGVLMVITDHINMTGINVLRGRTPMGGGPRFVDMTCAYGIDGREAWRAAAQQAGIALEEGVYLGVAGPSYETPAEVRMMQRLGGDAVGMSTVSEVLAARQIGMRVAGLSVITNPAAGLVDGELKHEDVTAAAGRVRGDLCRLLGHMVQAWR
jgi:purine-nucleoside phosphorylase